MYLMKKKLILFTFILIGLFALNASAKGSELVSDEVIVLKGQVIKVVNEEKKLIPGTEVMGVFQTLEINIIDGEESGKTIILESDYNSFDIGDKVYLNHVIRGDDGRETYIITDSYRLPTLLLFTIIFIVLVVFVGGVQGIRGLLSLAGSLLLIVFILIPGIMHGYSPVLLSIIISSFIIILGSYITHGFNRTTSSAVIGMIITVILTGLLAYLAVSYSKLTGFESDEAVFLNFNLKGNIDIVGILLSGIMIGLLGVLYDVAIGQSIAVEELHNIAPHVSKMFIYKRAIRMGREHIGALVNTLAIAYVGASLPILLLFSNSESGILEIINREVFSAEIIRTLIGSIGLVLAVPITTLITVFIIVKEKKTDDESLIRNEKEMVCNHNHTH
jgi:uncharacterized membrane protein